MTLPEITENVPLSAAQIYFAVKKFLKERAWKLFLRLDSDLLFYYGTFPPFQVIEVKVWADSLPLDALK